MVGACLANQKHVHFIPNSYLLCLHIFRNEKHACDVMSSAFPSVCVYLSLVNIFRT